MALPASGDIPLADLVEKAFDYRGDVTVVGRDGRSRVGYLFNRNRDVAVPFVQLFPAGGGEAETIPYGDIASIAFTGRDTAAGNSYAAWRKRKEAERAAAGAPGGPSPSAGE
jgi:hypothetical protein